MSDIDMKNIEDKLKAVENVLNTHPSSVVEVNDISMSELGFYELRFQNNKDYNFNETFYKDEKEGIGFKYARIHVSKRTQNEIKDGGAN